MKILFVIKLFYENRLIKHIKTKKSSERPADFQNISKIIFRQRHMNDHGTISDPHFSSKELLNKNLDISDLVNKLMMRRRQQLDAQYVSF